MWIHFAWFIAEVFISESSSAFSVLAASDNQEKILNIRILKLNMLILTQITFLQYVGLYIPPMYFWLRIVIITNIWVHIHKIKLINPLNNSIRETPYFLLFTDKEMEEQTGGAPCLRIPCKYGRALIQTQATEPLAILIPTWGLAHGLL